MARQNPFEKSGNGPEPAAYIPPPASKARRNRDWEAKHRDVVAYRGVPAELQAEIKAIAAALHVKVGEVARVFLEHGLAAYRRGEIALEPKLSAGRLSLYPEDESKWGNGWGQE